MKNILYYPSFEFKDLNWLKFALLYFDKVNLIIPDSADDTLSKDIQYVSVETDLINKYRPDSMEGYYASLDALEVMERLLRNPERYARLFRPIRISRPMRYNDRNLREEWECVDNQKYTLYNEKYSYEWSRFCIENKIGHETNEGVNIPEEIGLIYMSILSHIISEKKGFEAFTDRPSMDRYAMAIRKDYTAQSFEEKIQVARTKMELHLPNNLSQIDLKDIIKLRNSKDFKDKLHAFHNGMDKYYKEIEDGSLNKSSIDSFDGIYNEFLYEIFKLSREVAKISLGIWISTHANPLIAQSIVSEMIGAGVVVDAINQINKTWTNSRDSRYCKKYFSSLRKINDKRNLKKLEVNFFS
ncbi:hypothetical protein [Clostridium saccharoperbutylacetonicum]